MWSLRRRISLTDRKAKKSFVFMSTVFYWLMQLREGYTEVLQLGASSNTFPNNRAVLWTYQWWIFIFNNSKQWNRDFSGHSLSQVPFSSIMPQRFRPAKSTLPDRCCDLWSATFTSSLGFPALVWAYNHLSKEGRRLEELDREGKMSWEGLQFLVKIRNWRPPLIQQTK